MRAAHLAVDRPDISETGEMLAKAMSKPREVTLNCRRGQSHWQVSDTTHETHIVGRLRLDGRRAEQKINNGYGHRERITRLKHSVTPQSSVGLRSAEAEYHAMVRGMCFYGEVNHTFRTVQSR